MWVITVYLNKKITLFEFDTEEEAREASKSINGYKSYPRLFTLMILLFVLTEFVYIPFFSYVNLSRATLKLRVIM